MPAMEMNEPTRTITARTLEEGKSRLYKDYQGDYEILNKRTVLVGGFLGFGQHEEIEITYRLRNRGGNNLQSSYSQASYNQPAYVPRALSERSYSASPAADDFGKKREELLKTLSPQPEAKLDLNAISLKYLAKKIDEIDKKIDERPSVVASQEEHPTIVRIEEMLVQNEFTYSYIKKIKERIKATFSLDQLEDFYSVQKEIVDWIGESIIVSNDAVHRTPRIVIIVGPTGVGKTTTLVKLAAQNVIAAKKNQKPLRLCFITTDSMRVGAFEQLSRFAELFELDVLTAESADDVKKIYDRIRNSVDMIFIDTSGYSPNDSSHIGALKSVLDVPGLNPEVYLAFSASTKARDIKNIIQNYEPFAYKSVIVTKCDESNQYGNVISVLSEKNKSVSYITTGQKAAGCIEKASRIKFLIRLEDFEIDRDHIENKFGEK